MNIGAAVGGLIGGLIGAAVWAAIVFFTGYEVGYVAWGVGLAVGFGVVQGSGGALDMSTAVLAVVITVASLALGKYAATHFWVEQSIEEINNEPMPVEYLISYEADDVIAARIDAGTAVEWPEGVDPNMAYVEADYPGDVWAEAVGVWEDLDADGKAARRGRAEGSRADNLEAGRSEMVMGALKDSFSPIDLNFFALAIATAFKMTNGAEVEAA